MDALAIASKTLVGLALNSLLVPFEDALLLAQVAHVPLQPLGDKAAGSRGVHSVGLQTRPWAVIMGQWRRGGLRASFQSLPVALPSLLLNSLLQQYRDVLLKPYLTPLAFALQLDVALLRLLLVPLVILRTNTAVSSSPPNSLNPFSGLRQFFAQEGSAWATFTNRPYLESGLLDAALTVGTSALFSLLLEPFYDPSHPAHKQLSIAIAASFGAVGLGALHALVPLSTIKSRLLISPSTLSPAFEDRASTIVDLRPTPYASIVDCVRSTIREEGWPAFFRGTRELVWLEGVLGSLASVAGGLYGLLVARHAKAPAV